MRTVSSTTSNSVASRLNRAKMGDQSSRMGDSTTMLFAWAPSRVTSRLPLFAGSLVWAAASSAFWMSISAVAPADVFPVVVDWGFGDRVSERGENGHEVCCRAGLVLCVRVVRGFNHAD